MNPAIKTIPVDQLGTPSLGPDFRHFHMEEAPFTSRPAELGPQEPSSSVSFKAGDPLWVFRERSLNVTEAEPHGHVIFVHSVSELQVVSLYRVYVGLSCMFYIGKYILCLK